MPQTKTIIFDFDGVLSDSFDQYYRLNRDALASVGIELSEDHYRDLFNDNIHKGFLELIKNDELIKKFYDFKKNEINNYQKSINFFSEAVEFIKALPSDLRLGIVSAAPKKYIEQMLINEGIDSKFQYISGNWHPTKENAIREGLELTQSKIDDSLLISDTAGDILVAKEIGLKTCGVS